MVGQIFVKMQSGTQTEKNGTGYLSIQPGTQVPGNLAQPYSEGLFTFMTGSNPILQPSAENLIFKEANVYKGIWYLVYM